jgi:hypothetical protein
MRGPEADHGRGRQCPRGSLPSTRCTRFGGRFSETSLGHGTS